MFKRANNVSTCFCELAGRHTSFVFTDGARVYEKRDDKVEMLPEEVEGVLRSNEVWEDVVPIKFNISFEGIKKEAAGVAKYKIPAIVLAVCYVFFLFAQVLQVWEEKKSLQHYEKQLTNYYTAAGVVDKDDPYGILLSRASGGGGASYRVLDVLKMLSDSVDGVIIEGFSANEKSVKIDGTAGTFDTVEKFKTLLERHSGKRINVEDSRQTGESVRFVIRFEP